MSAKCLGSDTTCPDRVLQQEGSTHGRRRYAHKMILYPDIWLKKKMHIYIRQYKKTESRSYKHLIIIV